MASSSDSPDETDLISLGGPMTYCYFSTMLPVNPQPYTGNFGFIDSIVGKTLKETTSFESIPILTTLSRDIYKRKAYRHLPGILSTQQNGLISSEEYAFRVTKLKLPDFGDFRPKKMYPTLFDEQRVTGYREDNISCRFITSYNSCFLGAWDMLFGSLIEVIEKVCENRTDESFPPHTSHIIWNEVKTITDGDIVHMCPIDLEGNEYIVMCVNIYVTYDHKAYGRCRVFPVEENVNFRYLPIFEFFNRPIIYSSAWSSKQKVIVLGTHDRLCFDKLDGFNQMFKFYHESGEDHSAVEFSDSGNTVFTACGENLLSFDLRCAQWTKIAEVRRGVKYMNILRNDHTLITSGYNELLNVDIRMNRVAFKYPEFHNSKNKLEFTVNENWNVLCSPCDNNMTKLWDLKRGVLLASLDPPIESSDQVRAVLSVEENILSTNVFIADKMFCYEPLKL